MVHQHGPNNVDLSADIADIDNKGPKKYKWHWKSKRNIAIAAGTLLAIILAAVLWPRDSGDANAKYTFHTVTKSDMLISVQESGSVRAKNATDIKSEVEGKATVISIVPEGTYITEEDVNKGKILVELDSSDLRDRKTQQEITFASAQASYTDSTEDYSIQRKQNESDINAGQMKAKFSLMDLQKYLGETVAARLISRKNKKFDTISIEDAELVFKPLGWQEKIQKNLIASLVSRQEDGNEPAFTIGSLAFAPDLGGEALQKKRELQSKIDLANEEFKRAGEQLGWTQKLFDKEFVSRGELDADKLAAQRRTIELEQAQTEQELFLKYEFPKEAEKKLGDFYEAQMELDRVYAGARSKTAQSLAKLKSAEAQFVLQRERLAKLNKQLTACVIKASSSGLVVYSSSGGNPWSSREMIEAGSTVYERQTIMSLPNTADMTVEIKVHESSVDKIKPGQVSRIVVDAFPDEVLTGVINKVAPLPDQSRSWLNPDLKVYATQVGIDGTHNYLRPGMSARVEVIVQELQEVITVPIQAVVNRAGVKYCYVQDGSSCSPRPVTTGAFNDHAMQIVSGLDVGDKVAMNPPRVYDNSSLPVKSRAVPSRAPRGSGMNNAMRGSK